MDKVILKSLQEAIDSHWITVNEFFNLEALAMKIDGDIKSYERDQKRREGINQMLNTMEKEYPDMYKKLFDELHKA